MKRTFKTILLFNTLLCCILIFNSCKKGKIISGIDKELFEKANSTNDFTWFKKSSALLKKSSGSGHPQPFLRTRFNSIASSQLDSTGKILTNAVFPDGSLIVKELYSDTSKIDRYAILYKNSKSSDADSKGWVWGYINADETVAVAASKKGASCINCHSQTENIDYMLMNKYFP